MPHNLQLHWLTRQVKWQSWPCREFLRSFEGALYKGLNKTDVFEELIREVGVHDDPAPAIESISVVIDLNDRGGHLAAIFDAPSQRIEPRVN